MSRPFFSREHMGVFLAVGLLTTLTLGGWGFTCLVLPHYVPKALNQEGWTYKQLRWLGIILIILAVVASRVIVYPYISMWRAGEL
jgi:ABC-type enterochelin transport system permease subunit